MVYQCSLFWGIVGLSALVFYTLPLEDAKLADAAVLSFIVICAAYNLFYGVFSFFVRPFLWHLVASYLSLWGGTMVFILLLPGSAQPPGPAGMAYMLPLVYGFFLTGLFGVLRLGYWLINKRERKL